jgi:hypothetical protein
VNHFTKTFLKTHNFTSAAKKLEHILVETFKITQKQSCRLLNGQEIISVRLGHSLIRKNKFP